MTNIARILARPGSDWHAYHAPLTEEEIAEACQILGRLPPLLIELFYLCNGGAGSLPFEPGYFMLWSLEELVQLFEDAHYRKYYPSCIFFGGDGGGEYFGLDVDGRVFYMDPIAGEQSIVLVAITFDEFIAQVGTPPPSDVEATM